MSDDKFYKKQLAHCHAEEALDDQGNITVWAMGGFVPEATKEVDKFFKVSPPYKDSFGKNATIKDKVKQENDHRMALVLRMNNFLQSLEQTACSVRKAIMMSGLTRGLADKLRLRVPAFRARWEEIYEGVTDQLEEAGLQRAIYGVEEQVWHQGEPVGTKVVYSDSLLALMLQSRRSEVYKNRSEQKLIGDPTRPLSHEFRDKPLTKEEIAAELASRGLPSTVFDK